VEVKVREGQDVKKGDLLVDLRNPDEEIEHDKIEIELGTARIRARSYYQNDDLPAYQAELETIEGLEQKLAESRAYLAALQVTAPADGVVVGRLFDSLPGQWVEVGDEILSVIPDHEKELLISFRQDDIDSLADQVGRRIRVLLRGRSKPIEGEIERIESRATRALPHEVMAAPNGGPLALRASSDPLAEREQEIARGGGGYDSDLDYFSILGEQSQARELARARFAGRARILSDSEDPLLEGEWGFVRFANAEKERLGKWLFNEISGYIREKIEQAKAAAAA
jgi:biotin carboxyl carrier protein